MPHSLSSGALSAGKGASAGLEGFPHFPDNVHHLLRGKLLFTFHLFIHQRFHFLQQMLRLQTVVQQYPEKLPSGLLQGSRGEILHALQIFSSKEFSSPA